MLSIWVELAMCRASLLGSSVKELSLPSMEIMLFTRIDPGNSKLCSKPYKKNSVQSRGWKFAAQGFRLRLEG